MIVKLYDIYEKHLKKSGINSKDVFFELKLTKLMVQIRFTVFTNNKRIISERQASMIELRVVKMNEGFVFDQLFDIMFREIREEKSSV